MRLPSIALLLVAPLTVVAIKVSNVRASLVCSGTPSRAATAAAGSASPPPECW